MSGNKSAEKLLKEYLSCDSDTGVLTWKKKPATNAKIGGIAGSKSCGYIKIRFRNKLYCAHRIAWLFAYGEWPKQIIDHINGIKDDNRICNLRDVSNRENQRNRKAHRSGRLVGATFDKSDKRWKSRVKKNKKPIHLGGFDTEIEAHEAYKNYFKQESEGVK